MPDPVIADTDLTSGAHADPGEFVEVAPPAPPPAVPGHVALINFDQNGHRLLRFHRGGSNLDAHDGEIERFGDLYYLYGASYGCGFHWRTPGTPFCGIKVYSSPDLIDWKYEGTLFNYSTREWQKRCDGSTFGCFRPHVAFNRSTNKFVLWVNVYDLGVGYRVFESSSPTGPFDERRPPRLAASGATVDTINMGFNGDHNLFVDDDGTGYVVYTDRRRKSDIVIERLTPDYLSGTGAHTRLGVVNGEAPTMFRRGEHYYIMFSDPTCAYCGTHTGYFMARNPLGPWTPKSRQQWSSCGGQPAHVSELPAADGGKVYLYQSDLWNDYERNQSTASHFWTPLQFAPNGDIIQFSCAPHAYAPIAVSGVPSSGRAITDQRLRVGCEVRGGPTFAATQLRVAIQPKRSGRLRSLAVMIFKKGRPNSPLKLEIEASSGSKRSATIDPDSMSYNIRRYVIPVDMEVDTTQQYFVRLSTASRSGCFGFGYYPKDPSEGEAALFQSSDGGQTWVPESDRVMKMDLRITGPGLVTHAN